MTDGTIAQFVARNALAQGTSIERVAQAFHALVRDVDRRERLVAMAHDDAAASPLGATEGFEQAWETVAQKMMTSYSDKPFVSDDYARELSGTRTKAIDIEQLQDDPPERLAAWLGTVATTELRKLDLTLVLDLLRIEQNTERWATLMRPVVDLIEDLLLVGDFDAAADLAAALLVHTSADAAGRPAPGASSRRRQAGEGPDDAAHRRRISRRSTTASSSASRRCASRSARSSSVRSPRRCRRKNARGRATVSPPILIAFGASGRREAERLKNSPNAAVRRTAIYLLREFGGSEALPELTELLNDNEQQVQREAVRAIMQDRNRFGLPGPRKGAHQRHRAVPRHDHAGADARPRRAGDTAVRVHPQPRRSPRPARLDLHARDRGARERSGIPRGSRP